MRLPLSQLLERRAPRQPALARRLCARHRLGVLGQGLLRGAAPCLFAMLSAPPHSAPARLARQSAHGPPRPQTSWQGACIPLKSVTQWLNGFSDGRRPSNNKAKRGGGGGACDRWQKRPQSRAPRLCSGPRCGTSRSFLAIARAARSARSTRETAVVPSPPDLAPAAGIVRDRCGTPDSRAESPAPARGSAPATARSSPPRPSTSAAGSSGGGAAMPAARSAATASGSPPSVQRPPERQCTAASAGRSAPRLSHPLLGTPCPRRPRAASPAATAPCPRDGSCNQPCAVHG